MQNTSDLYKEILRGEYSEECRLAVGKKDSHVEDMSTFYGMDSILTMSTSIQVFSTGTPSVGGCPSGEINVEMLKPSGTIPRQAKLVPQIRLTDGVRYSEWIPKGVYFVDTRVINGEGTSIETISLHGYDSMLKSEQDYPESKLDWPAKDIDVVKEIATFIGVSIDPRTISTMSRGYVTQYPGDYSCRETLGFIAAMYGGNFIMNDIGELRLVCVNEYPQETRYLVDKTGTAITFGGVRILV